MHLISIFAIDSTYDESSLLQIKKHGGSVILGLYFKRIESCIRFNNHDLLQNEHPLLIIKSQPKKFHYSMDEFIFFHIVEKLYLI